ncbi:MAG: gliding motility-associated C-terminal domain-containing protein [Bacteroidota bacterium]
MRLFFRLFFIIPLLPIIGAATPTSTAIGVMESSLDWGITQTDPCPDFSVDFMGLDTLYCLNNSPVTLSATIVNGTSGSFNWNGAGVNGDQFTPADAGVGQHTIILRYQETGLCVAIDSITFEVYDIPTVGIALSDREICFTDTLTVQFNESLPTGTTYDWSFEPGTIESGSGPGPYELTYDSAGRFSINLTVSGPGCDQPVAIDRARIQISEPIDSVNLRCGDFQLNSLNFIWDNLPEVVAYRYRLEGEDFVFTADTTVEVAGLLPGDSVLLEVVPLGSSACGNGPTETLYCFTQPCPDFSIDFSSIPTILCLDSSSAPIPLEPVVLGGSGVNSAQFWDGPGIRNDTFFPAIAGPGQHWLALTYIEKGPCGIVDSTLIEVYQVEAGIFTLAPNQACLGDTVTVNYIGNASENAEFDWDFGDLDTIGDNIRNNIMLTFDSSGFYPVSLTITERGCRSFATTIEDSVRIVDPLPPVGLLCGDIRRNEITFDWPDNPNATGYLLQRPGGGPFAQLNSSYTLSDLSPGSEETLIVTALGQFPCGDGPPDTITCVTPACPNITLDLSNIPTNICNYRQAEPVTLIALQNGGNGVLGQFFWSGPGVIGNQFFPNAAGPGNHEIRVEYVEEGPCNAFASMMIEVFTVPVADFDLSPNQICLRDDSTIVTFTGTAGPNAIYEWAFDGGTVISGDGAGPYTIAWGEEGRYAVSLSVVENGCRSAGAAALDSVSVFAPLGNIELNCARASLTTLSFSWTDLPGAEFYEVENLQDGNAVVQVGNEITITGLTPGQDLSVAVTSLAVNVCGDGGSDTLSCQAQPCPDLSFDFSPFPQEFCFNEGLDSIRLPNRVAGAVANGVFSWSGTGVRLLGDDYFFSPLFAGPGTFTLTASYYVTDPLDFTGVRLCAIDSSFTVVVHPKPNANAGEDQSITCQRPVATLNGSLSSGDSLRYLWSSNDPNVNIEGEQNSIIAVTDAGNYTLRVTNSFGCFDADIVNVSSRNIPLVPNYEFFHVSCFGEVDGAISLIEVANGTPPFQIIMNGRPVTGTSFRGLAAGEYTLELVDFNGCTATTFITINEPDPLEVVISSPDDISAIPSGNTIDLVADIFGGSIIDSIYWLPEGVGTANFNRFRITVTEERNIEVNVIDEAGCRASDRVSLIITEPDPVFVPSGFSPNGDNNNDLFVIGANEQLVEIIERMEIYDRWGNQVFRAENFPPNDPRFGWDGTSAGRRINAAVYVYYAIVRLASGERIVLEGSITLVK